MFRKWSEKNSECRFLSPHERRLFCLLNGGSLDVQATTFSMITSWMCTFAEHSNEVSTSPELVNHTGIELLYLGFHIQKQS